MAPICRSSGSGCAGDCIAPCASAASCARKQLERCARACRLRGNAREPGARARPAASSTQASNSDRSVFRVMRKLQRALVFDLIAQPGAREHPVPLHGCGRQLERSAVSSMLMPTKNRRFTTSASRGSSSASRSRASLTASRSRSASGALMSRSASVTRSSPAPRFSALLLPRVVDQDAPHRECGSAKEMPAVLPFAARPARVADRPRSPGRWAAGCARCARGACRTAAIWRNSP